MSPAGRCRPIGAARACRKALARALARLAAVGGALSVAAAPLRPLDLPTANRALLEAGGEERFFVGTAGQPWTRGTFGCVRSGGAQLHEGLDIRSVQRDRHGEPTDPVRAAAAGTVAYANRTPSLSNYGNYLVLRHEIEGLEIYSLYAHLREIRAELTAGRAVQAGEVLGTLGRTSNTRQTIARERAHLHFELNLFVNDRFPAWYRKTFPTQRNDHGLWNGQNLVGLDARALFLAEQAAGERFSLLGFVRAQPVLCRVLVRATEFPWVRRYRFLVRANPRAEREGVAGYELALAFNGLPVEAIPRARSELRGAARFVLLSVNAAEHLRAPCGKLVQQRNSRWELTPRGTRLLDLITY